MSDRRGAANRLARPDGGSLAWWSVGAGESTILWVHGLPLDSASWSPQIAHFETRVRNILVDLRGYGASSELPAQAGSVTALYVDDLVALLDAIGGPPPVVVGFASAGHVVLRLAARHGARIAGLVSINGLPRFLRGDDWSLGFDATGLDRFAAPLRYGELDVALDRILDPGTVFRDVDQATARRLAERFRAMGERAGSATLRGFFDDMAHDDDRALLPLVTVPVLLIASAAGQEVPQGVALYLRETIGHATLAEIAGADHFVFANRPALVNALVDDFAGSLGAR